MFDRTHRSARSDAGRNPSAGFLTISLVCLAIGCFALGCAPEVGSDAWCDQLKETPKGDWSANEAADYAKHCLFR